MRKIMFFTISLRKGGAERVICNLSNKLVEKNEVSIVLLEDDISYHLDSRVNVVKLCSIGDVKNGILKILLMPYYSYFLLKYIRENNIETINSFLLRANVISILVKLFSKSTRVIISERSNPVAQYATRNISNRINKYLIRKLYPLANVITVNSFGTLTALRDRYKIKSRIEIIYNPINAEFHVSNSEEIVKHNSFTFVTVGRLDEGKNHIVLLESVRELIKSGVTGFCVKIIGEGALKKQLQDFCEKYNIAGYVDFLGQRNDIPDLLKKCHSFIFTSKREGFPNVLLEALAAKLPVITSDCAFGPREIFSGENILPKTSDEFFDIFNSGILVPVNNSALTAKAMEHIMVNYNCFTVDRELLEKYKVERVVKQFYSLQNG